MWLCRRLSKPRRTARQSAPLRGAGSGAPRAGLCLGRAARRVRAVPARPVIDKGRAPRPQSQPARALCFPSSVATARPGVGAPAPSQAVTVIAPRQSPATRRGDRLSPERRRRGADQCHTTRMIPRLRPTSPRRPPPAPTRASQRQRHPGGFAGSGSWPRPTCHARSSRSLSSRPFCCAMWRRGLGLSPGQTLIDPGCGRGGPGLWLAREADVWLVGVDFSSVAADQAAHRAALFGLGNRARFVVGDLISTALPDASAAAAVPIERPQRAHGAELLGEVAQYQCTFRLCCPRGQHRRPAGTTQLTRASRK